MRWEVYVEVTEDSEPCTGIHGFETYEEAVKFIRDQVMDGCEYQMFLYDLELRMGFAVIE